MRPGLKTAMCEEALPADNLVLLPGLAPWTHLSSHAAGYPGAGAYAAPESTYIRTLPLPPPDSLRRLAPHATVLAPGFDCSLDVALLAGHALNHARLTPPCLLIGRGTQVAVSAVHVDRVAVLDPPDLAAVLDRVAVLADLDGHHAHLFAVRAHIVAACPAPDATPVITKKYTWVTHGVRDV